MKSRIFLVLLIVAAATLWANNSGAGWSTFRNLWRRVEMPFRAARLMAEPPDQHLSMPVAGVKPRQIADTWHAARGTTRQHEGQDIFAARGTPIKSATDGIIVRIGEDRLGGHIVSVLGPGGRTYYYAHLDHYAVNEHVGDEVRRGTVIGYVGNTGNARTTPPHLHFGVYGPTGAINPLPLLKGNAANS